MKAVASAKRSSRLGEAMRLYRTVNGRTIRDVSKEIGVGIATLWRIEIGQAIDAATLIKLLAWLLESKETRS